MFSIRFTNGMTHETVYTCNAYTVTRPAVCTDDHPVITMALSVDVSPHPHDHRAVSMEVAEAAFVMNETGKTIDRIFSEKKLDGTREASTFYSASNANLESRIIPMDDDRTC